MIFISYAREDRVYAARLSNQLDEVKVPHWIDVKSIAPGQDWKREITLALKSANYFVLLLSNNSISKRGYVQREIKEALEYFKEFPAGEVFIIPVRIENCEPQDLELKDLNWFDIFPDVELGFFNLVNHLKSLIYKDKPEQAVTQIGSKGAYTVFAPYKSFGEILRMFFSTFPRTFAGNSEIAYFITVKSDAKGVDIPRKVREQFPELVMLVLQHQYQNLRPGAHELKVDLWFYGEKHTVIIPYDAVISIGSPQLEFSINRDLGGTTGSGYHVEGLKRRIAELEKQLRKKGSGKWKFWK